MPVQGEQLPTSPVPIHVMQAAYAHRQSRQKQSQRPLIGGERMMPLSKGTRVE